MYYHDDVHKIDTAFKTADLLIELTGYDTRVYTRPVTYTNTTLLLTHCAKNNIHKACLQAWTTVQLSG